MNDGFFDQNDDFLKEKVMKRLMNNLAMIASLVVLAISTSLLTSWILSITRVNAAQEKNTPGADEANAGPKWGPWDNLASFDLERKRHILSLYRTAFIASTDMSKSAKARGKKTCWGLAGGACCSDLDGYYQYQCCCDLTIGGCSSDWMERRKCSNGVPVGDWEELPGTDCTKLLLRLYKYGSKRKIVRGQEVYVPITKDEYLKLLSDNEGIDASRIKSLCHMIGTPPYASCIGDCDNEFQYCKLKNVGDYFYCTCSVR